VYTASRECLHCR